MSSFIAIIHKDAESDFGVSFPDLPGCITVGVDMDEALELAGEALSLHLRGMKEDGEPIPTPSSLRSIMDQPEYRDGVAVLIGVSSEIDPLVRIGASLPVEEVRMIDDYADSQGMTRSDLVIRSVRRTVGVA